MKGDRFNGTRGAFFSTWKVMGIWNELPEGVIEVATFKQHLRHLEGYMDRKGLRDTGQIHGPS